MTEQDRKRGSGGGGGGGRGGVGDFICCSSQYLMFITSIILHLMRRSTKLYYIFHIHLFVHIYIHNCIHLGLRYTVLHSFILNMFLRYIFVYHTGNIAIFV